MSFPFFIAKRYLFSSKTKTAVNIISFVSMIGVIIGTAALVLLLSVFNGFENLLLSMYNSFDPHLKITSNLGKTFNSESIISDLGNNEEILYFTEVLEEKVLMKNGEHEFIATIKGVGEDFIKMTNLDSIIVEGENFTNYKHSNVAILGQGVAYHLSMGVGNMFSQLKIFVPNRGSKTLLNPSSAFSYSSVLPIGIFSLGAEYDSKYIITPIVFLQDLLQKKGVSAIEVQLKNENKMLEVQKYLQSNLGENYKVSNRLQQHAVLHKILNSEKLGVFIILTFMLIIATFNIIGSLSMLMIEKKKDIKTFWNLGATQKSIQQIFFIEGMLTIIIGSFLGILLGLLLATLQMKFGIIGMGEGNFIIHSYPVSIDYFDLFLVEITVLIIGLFASWYPANILSKRLIN
ncbi:MAG: ABC transporter permease [Flavobacteriales bacterium]|nr:ABC transporter permease [Flavobacteriales bacterium]